MARSTKRRGRTTPMWKLRKVSHRVCLESLQSHHSPLLHIVAGWTGPPPNKEGGSDKGYLFKVRRGEEASALTMHSYPASASTAPLRLVKPRVQGKVPSRLLVRKT